MKVYFFQRKHLIIGLILSAVILTSGYAFTNFLYHYFAVPTSEISPIYQGCSDKKYISFAVNVDWGEEYIPKMLEIFNKEQIKCTFFLTGYWTERFPDVAKSIAINDHEIGSHGYKHTSPNNMSFDNIKADIKKSEKIIKFVTGRETILYAPPSGEREDHVIKAAHELGYQTILWSVDTIDWKRPAPNIIVKRIMDKAHNGAIVLMHPTETTIMALPIVIPQLKKEGYQFVTISENIQQDSVESNE